MMPNVVEFERLVRDYVAGCTTWNTVHDYAVEMEWKNVLDFHTNIREELSALHMAFMSADEGDDPQFRLDRSEIQKLIDDLNRAQGTNRPA
jgi:hypothetical protein